MRKFMVASVVAGLVGAGAVGVMAMQPGGPRDGGRDSAPGQERERGPGHAPGQPGQRGQGGDMAGQLIQALRETPGCLGVDAAMFMSGKQAIHAWFENKAAVVAWYETEAHQRMMAGFSEGEDEYDAEEAEEPLAHVTDEETPILVIAALTPRRGGPGGPSGAGAMGGMPISQISIELYAPLPGGAFVNGRLAPEGFKVPHMREYQAEKE